MVACWLRLSPPIALTQFMKHFLNPTGTRKPTTLPQVSWECIPLSGLRNFLNFSNSVFPNSSISPGPSAKQTTPHMVLAKVPSSSWRLVLLIRGLFSSLIESGIVTNVLFEPAVGPIPQRHPQFYSRLKSRSDAVALCVQGFGLCPNPECDKLGPLRFLCRLVHK